MAYDVFVGHSSADRMLANVIVHELEAEGIHCWITPRNIVPVINYVAAIVAAIQEAQVIEVEGAAAHNVSLVPFRIADIDQK